MNKDIFVERYSHEGLVNRIKEETYFNRGKKHHLEFINHYYDNYDSPELPPSWMIAEALSIGTWSIVFDHIKSRDDQKEVCKHYGIPYIIMRSWLHTLTYLRNLCAH